MYNYVKPYTFTEVKMQIKNLYAGSFASNCYIISDGGHAAIIDPSAPAEELLEYIKANDLTVDYIILTHGHFDHMLTLKEVKDITLAPICIHRDDAENLSDGRKNAYSVFFGGNMTFPLCDKQLLHGDTLPLGNTTLRIIHTPGHTKGCICIEADNALITGDTLFADSYGRCDLYGGNFVTLLKSLGYLREYGKNKNLTIYPGHGGTAKLLSALDIVEYL